MSLQEVATNNSEKKNKDPIHIVQKTLYVCECRKQCKLDQDIRRHLQPDFLCNYWSTISIHGTQHTISHLPFHMQPGRRHQPVLSQCSFWTLYSDKVVWLCMWFFYERSIQKATKKEFIALTAWDTCSHIRVTLESNTDYCAIIGIATEILMLCEWCVTMHTQDVTLLCWYRY